MGLGVTAYRHRITGKFVGAAFAAEHPELVEPPHSADGATSGDEKTLVKEALVANQDPINVALGETESILAVYDRITVRLATELQEAALQVAAQPNDAVLDCTGLTHLDTAAIQVLIALRSEFASSSTEMRIHGLDEAVQTSMEASGLWARLVG
jgi:anti-anti-sigma factor